MKILITGKDGQLAKALVTKSRSNYKLFVFNNENGVVILDNIHIVSYLDFKVKYIFKINRRISYSIHCNNILRVNNNFHSNSL